MKLAKYRFVIRPKRELILPTYKGSTFRGGFGHAFKNAMCNARTGNCLECKDRYGCVYYYVFETANPSKAGGNLKNMQIPHPFVIEPSLDKSEHFGLDDELSFNLILIGKAIDYIPYFVLAFEELGRMGIGKNKGKYRLEEVFSLNGNEEMLIYDSKSHIKEGYEALDSN
ncbi:MAG: hypothetical protein SWO11_17730, partial [Thermodesulfobacteriota bacterium]|nr:hypothetical protein [Thermodesulfobacteriota bacterium]